MSPGYRSLMWYLLYGTRGGPNRRRLLGALEDAPANAHQLAERLGLDYRTVRHHLRILEKNGAIARPVGEAYATPYELCASTSAYLESIGHDPTAARAAGRHRSRPAAYDNAEALR
jgi:DNA-binding transcriptional ArsR family regulator